MRVKAPSPNSQPQAPAEPRPLHRTTPLAASMTTVTGYPSKLVIYQLRASRFWWVRYYAHGKIARKSTKAACSVACLPPQIPTWVAKLMP